MFTLYLKVKIMDSNKYLDDLQEIKKLMNHSSRFLSLSGVSGIMAGIYALAGAGIGYWLLGKQVYRFDLHNKSNQVLIIQLISVALIVAFLTLVTAYYLTRKKAVKKGESVWNDTTKIMLFHFVVPMLTGGIFGLILLYHNHYGIIAPITLIFYGLALVNASKYTLDTVKYLGLSEIIIGLIAAIFTGYGLYFWAFGFGILHIIYGIVMYRKETN